MLIIAHHFARSARWRHALFAVAATLTILLIGYHYGTFDQSIHIPFLKKFADPTLYRGNEAFLDLRFQHYSYFWFLFIPFYKAGILEPVLFIVHFLATYCAFWVLWGLADTLFHDPLANLLTVVAFIVPHIGFSAFPIFEWSLLNRTAMLPLVLWAITLFLQRRYVWALALLGVIFNFHVLSAGFVLCLFMLALAVDFKKIGWRAAGAGGVMFTLTALPLLIWRVLSPPLRLTPDPDWFNVVSNGLFQHLFYLVAPYPYIWLVTLCGVSALALFIIAAQAQIAPEHDRTLRAFVGAALLLVGVQALATYVAPITLIIQSQIMRAGLLALILGYVYFAGYLAAQYRAGVWRGWDFGLLVLAFISGLAAVLPVLAWLILRVVRSALWRKIALAFSISAIFFTTLGIAFMYDLWSPGIYVFMRHTPWHDAQAWAREHTPPDAIFITPLTQFWFYDAEWRVFSERAQVVALSDILEIALVPDYLPEWKTRFERLAPGALAQFNGDVFENLALTENAYNSLSDTALLEAAHTYAATYLVVEKPHLRPWPVVYENTQFVIYQLP